MAKARAFADAVGCSAESCNLIGGEFRLIKGGGVASINSDAAVGGGSKLGTSVSSVDGADSSTAIIGEIVSAATKSPGSLA